MNYFGATTDGIVAYLARLSGAINNIGDDLDEARLQVLLDDAASKVNGVLVSRGYSPDAITDDTPVKGLRALILRLAAVAAVKSLYEISDLGTSFINLEQTLESDFARFGQNPGILGLSKPKPENVEEPEYTVPDMVTRLNSYLIKPVGDTL